MAVPPADANPFLKYIKEGMSPTVQQRNMLQSPTSSSPLHAESNPFLDSSSDQPGATLSNEQRGSTQPELFGQLIDLDDAPLIPVNNSFAPSEARQASNVQQTNPSSPKTNNPYHNLDNLEQSSSSRSGGGYPSNAQNFLETHAGAGTESTSDGVPRATAPPTSNEPIPSEVAFESYPTKMISLPPPYGDTFVRIILQNENGPCSLLALLNVLILRGEIKIPENDSVSSHLLYDILRNYYSSKAIFSPELFNRMQKGLNLNPRFGSVDGFASTPDKLDQQAFNLFTSDNIPVVHGWLADPSNEKEWDALVSSTESFEDATLILAQAQEICDRHQLNVTLQGASADDSWEQVQLYQHWSPEEKVILSRAFAINDFLSTHPTQLSYHGLSQLNIQTEPGNFYALFRNAHFLVLYHSNKKHIPLMTLVTDSSFGEFSEIVWESLSDIDGAQTQFFNSDLKVSRVGSRHHQSRSRSHYDRNRQQQMASRTSVVSNTSDDVVDRNSKRKSKVPKCKTM